VQLFASSPSCSQLLALFGVGVSSNQMCNADTKLQHKKMQENYVLCSTWLMTGAMHEAAQHGDLLVIFLRGRSVAQHAPTSHTWKRLMKSEFRCLSYFASTQTLFPPPVYPLASLAVFTARYEKTYLSKNRTVVS